MSLALNLNEQIQHIPKRIIFKRRSWKKAFAVGVVGVMVGVSPLLYFYMLTNSHMTKSMTLEQYASSPPPQPVPKDYLGS